MVDVWKELFLAVAGDQQLRSQFNVLGIFEHIAELSGAKNLDKFKVDLQQLPPGQEPPPGAVPLQSPGQTPGVVSNPGTRLAGGL
jgi:hypothetical protein